MKNVLINGAGLHLTGCEMIRLEVINRYLYAHGISLQESISCLSRISQKSMQQMSTNLESLAITAREIDVFPNIAIRKPKICQDTKQQHKWAARNYRK